MESMQNPRLKRLIGKIIEAKRAGDGEFSPRLFALYQEYEKMRDAYHAEHPGRWYYQGLDAEACPAADDIAFNKL